MTGALTVIKHLHTQTEQRFKENYECKRCASSKSTLPAVTDNAYMCIQEYTASKGCYSDCTNYGPLNNWVFFFSALISFTICSNE